MSSAAWVGVILGLGVLALIGWLGYLVMTYGWPGDEED